MRALPSVASSAAAEAGVDCPKTGEAALELRGIHKRYPTRPGTVLDGVELVVERGSVVHIGGDNGAGKTTLLRLVTGVVAPDAGTVRVLGLDPDADRRTVQRSIGFASAGNAGVYARLTVEQHLDIWGRIAFVAKREHAGRVTELLAQFRLEELANQRCDRISMGQRQRLRLAMAFVGSPKLALLDEPLTSLDGAGRAVLAAAIEEMTGQGGSVVWCSPDRSEVPISTARAFRLAQGRLQALGA